MEETVQFNIRMSKALVEDLESISKHYNLSKSDWLRVKLAEMVRDEMQNIVIKMQKKFINGVMSEEEYVKQTGRYPTKWLIEKKKKAEEIANKAQEDYIRDIVARADKNGVGHFDKYLTKIIKKLNNEKIRKKISKK